MDAEADLGAPRWRMPHEGEPHARTWMAWPSSGYGLGGSPAEAEEARATWAAVANAVARFEPVTLLVTESESAEARRRLDGSVQLVTAALDDGWYRDSGPTFVVDAVAPARLGAVEWVFNGWGQQDWARWQHDAVASGIAARASRARSIPSPLVCEGGAVHTDGAGTVLTTDAVLRDPGRNPGWSRARIEAELTRTIGAERVVWLERGLTRDSERFGTRGHVDIVAAFAAEGRVLMHDQRDRTHPDAAVSAEVREALTAARDAKGRPFEVVPLPAPRTLRDAGGWLDWSYVNHYVLNGAVVACVFDDPADADALAALRDAYPGREVVGVDARPLFERGGGIHCITQQQPA